MEIAQEGWGAARSCRGDESIRTRYKDLAKQKDHGGQEFRDCKNAGAGKSQEIYDESMLEEVARYQIWIASAEPIVIMLLSSFERALTKTSGGCWRMRDVRSRILGAGHKICLDVDG